VIPRTPAKRGGREREEEERKGGREGTEGE